MLEMFKRIGKIFIVLSFIVGVASPVLAVKPYQGLRINVLWPANPEEALLKEYVVEWERQTGAEVKITELPENMMRERLLMECGGHTGSFDVLFVDFMWTAEFAKGGYLEGLDKYIRDPKLANREELDINDFIPRVFSGTVISVFDDGVYGLPSSVGGGLIAYRKDLFKKAGFATTPSTPAQVLEYARKLTDEQRGIYGYSMMCKRGAHASHNYLFQNLCFGTRLLGRDFHAKVNEEPSVKTVEFLVSLISYCPPRVTEFGWDENIAAFQSGEATMARIYSPYARTLSDPEVSQVPKENVGFYISPPAKGIVGATSLFGSWIAAISVDSKNKEAAYKLIEYLCSKDVQRRWALKGGPVCRFSTATDPEILKNHPQYKKALWFFMDPGCNPSQRVKIPEYGAIEDTMGRWLNEAYNKWISPQEAMNKAAEEIDALLAEAGYFTPGTDAYNTPKAAVASTREELKYFDRFPLEWIE